MLLLLQHTLHCNRTKLKLAKKQQDQKGETEVNAHTEHQDPANQEARPELVSTVPAI